MNCDGELHTSILLWPDRTQQEIISYVHSREGDEELGLNWGGCLNMRLKGVPLKLFYTGTLEDLVSCILTLENIMDWLW